MSERERERGMEGLVELLLYFRGLLLGQRAVWVWDIVHGVCVVVRTFAVAGVDDEGIWWRGEDIADFFYDLQVLGLLGG